MHIPSGSGGKESSMQETQADTSSIPGLGRSPGGGHGNPLQYPCLENHMDRGTWDIGSQRVRQAEMTELTNTHIY